MGPVAQQRREQMWPRVRRHCTRASRRRLPLPPAAAMRRRYRCVVQCIALRPAPCAPPAAQQTRPAARAAGGGAFRAVAHGAAPGREARPGVPGSGTFVLAAPNRVDRFARLEPPTVGPASYDTTLYLFGDGGQSVAASVNLTRRPALALRHRRSPKQSLLPPPPPSLLARSLSPHPTPHPRGRQTQSSHYSGSSRVPQQGRRNRGARSGHTGACPAAAASW